MIDSIVMHTKVRVAGHSGAAPHGHDLVCCAVSTLFQTLTESIKSLCPQDEIQSQIKPGDSWITWTGASEQMKILIDAFFIGCTRIEEVYPQYVTVTSA